MTRVRVESFTISLDGYGAVGPIVAPAQVLKGARLDDGVVGIAQTRKLRVMAEFVDALVGGLDPIQDDNVLAQERVTEVVLVRQNVDQEDVAECLANL